MSRLDTFLLLANESLLNPIFSHGEKCDLKLHRIKFIKMQEIAAINPFLIWRSCQHVGESQPTHHLFPACITNIVSALPSSRHTLTY